MPVDVCVESYAAFVHAVDALLSTTWFMHTRVASANGSDPTWLRSEFFDSRRSFTDLVRQQVDALPIEQAHALWLVDVCDCSYEQAAAEIGASVPVIAGRVRSARRQIRHRLPAGT
jgi:DNA-directed RNA polymerase specialized sigma24 family protein